MTLRGSWAIISQFQGTSRGAPGVLLSGHCLSGNGIPPGLCTHPAVCEQGRADNFISTPRYKLLFFLAACALDWSLCIFRPTEQHSLRQQISTSIMLECSKCCRTKVPQANLALDTCHFVRLPQIAAVLTYTNMYTLWGWGMAWSLAA